MTDAEELELLELENENAGATKISNGSLSPGHGLGDLKIAESMPAPYEQPAYLKAQLAGAQPGALQALRPVAQFASSAAQALSMGPVNAAVQGVQDNWGHPLNAAGGVIANEAKNLASPFHTFEKPVQGTSESLQRMGVDNAPQKPPMRYPGEVFPGGNAPIMGLADQAALVADNAAPAVAGELGPKLAATALSRAGKLGGRAAGALLEKPATQSLLGKLGYNPELMANSIPDAAGLGAEANAPQIVAQKLKAYDLLHPPEKANVNLQAGLQKYGDAIDKIVQKGTEADVRVNPQAVLDAFAKRRAQLLNQTGKGSTSFTDLVRNAIPKIQAAVNKLRPDETGTVPLEKGVNFRRDLQDMVKNWGDGPNKGLIQDVAKELQSEMNVEIKSAHPIYGPQLDKLNGKYSDLMDMAPMIEDAAKAAFTKSATGTNGIEIPHTRYGVVGKLINAPRVTAMDLMPGVADRIANRAGVSAIPEDVIPSVTPPSTVTPEDLQALRGSAPSAPTDALPPRGVTGRPALDKPPTFAPGPSVPRAFGPAAPPSAPAADPMADLYPTNRNPAMEAPQGAPGIEGMMSPEDAAGQPADIRASWEAAIRQARPVRVPPLPEPAGGVQVINPQDLPLSPRTPKGSVQPNGFPPLQESDAIRRVLDNANRRPLASNQPSQETIDALKKLLKQELPKARKQEILKLIQDEIHKTNLLSFGEGP